MEENCKIEIMSSSRRCGVRFEIYGEGVPLIRTYGYGWETYATELEYPTEFELDLISAWVKQAKKYYASADTEEKGEVSEGDSTESGSE